VRTWARSFGADALAGVESADSLLERPLKGAANRHDSPTDFICWAKALVRAGEFFELPLSEFLRLRSRVSGSKHAGVFCA